MMKYATALLIGLLTTAALGQEVEIVSFHGNGTLTWANATTGVVCHVEWASSLSGSWFRTWTDLANLRITNHTTTVAVPMFYRVVCVTGGVNIVTAEVANASFESPDISGYSNTKPTAWTGTGWDCGLNDQDCGQFTAPDGTQVAFANTGLVLYQTLTNLLTAGGQYSLTIAVGTRANLGGGYDIRLKAGGVLLASTNATLAAAAPFSDVTLDFVVPEGHPQLGQPVTIELAGTTQPQYDNVRLVIRMPQ